MKQSNTWIISDTHFGHDALIKNGYRKDNFGYEIANNCFNAVKDGDTVIHLGDVAFYNHGLWNDIFLKSIRLQRSILVMGNHDKQTYSWYYTQGWHFVCDKFSMKKYGRKFVFSHVPMEEKYLLPGEINIHGHLHDCTYREAVKSDRHVLINIEDTLSPISLKSISDSID